jgi:hypothetical protein
LYRLLKPVRRRTNYFDLFVNVIRHALIISRLGCKTIKIRLQLKRVFTL